MKNATVDPLPGIEPAALRSLQQLVLSREMPKILIFLQTLLQLHIVTTEMLLSWKHFWPQSSHYKSLIYFTGLVWIEMRNLFFYIVLN